MNRSAVAVGPCRATAMKYCAMRDVFDLSSRSAAHAPEQSSVRIRRFGLQDEVGATDVQPVSQERRGLAGRAVSKLGSRSDGCDGREEAREYVKSK